MKSFGGVTVRVSVPEALSMPELATMATEKIPVTAVDDALSVRVEAALPPAGTVRLAGVNAPSTPPGKPGRLRLMLWLELPWLITLIVAVDVEPSAKVSAPGVITTVNPPDTPTIPLRLMV